MPSSIARATHGIQMPGLTIHFRPPTLAGMEKSGPDSFLSSLLAETARRFGLAPESLPAPEGFGPRPRLGQILDAAGTREASGATQFALGPYNFSPAELLLSAPGKTVRLTEKERDLLLALLGAPGLRLGRGALLETVWRYAGGVETHTLETHIYRLRQKIESDPARPEILVTDGDCYVLVVSPA